MKTEYTIQTPFATVRRWGHQLVRREPKANNVFVSMSAAEKHNLDQLAELLGCSRSWIIRFLVMDFTRQALKDANVKHYTWEDLARPERRNGRDSDDSE